MCLLQLRVQWFADCAIMSFVDRIVDNSSESSTQIEAR